MQLHCCSAVRTAMDRSPVESLEMSGAADLKHRDRQAEFVHILSYQLPMDLFRDYPAFLEMEMVTPPK